MATVVNHYVEFWVALAALAPFVMARFALGGKK